MAAHHLPVKLSVFYLCLLLYVTAMATLIVFTVMVQTISHFIINVQIIVEILCFSMHVLL